jgi:uncharacterized phage infection (PIP) family protein YhgE
VLLMRFVYGFILGVLVSVIAAILYLAFSGGEYLLQLSPRYHEMASTIVSLRDVKDQRDQLATRLDALADGFDQLTRRFNELQETMRESPHHRAPLAEAPAPPAEPPPPPPTPRPRPRVEPPLPPPPAQ